MNIPKTKKELSERYQKIQQSIMQLGNESQRIVGQIQILDKLESEEKEVKENKK